MIKSPIIHLFTLHANRVEERLDEYSQKFDVVLLGDGDLTYIIGLLRELISDEGQK